MFGLKCVEFSWELNGAQIGHFRWRAKRALYGPVQSTKVRLIHHLDKHTVNQRLLVSANTEFLCDIFFSRLQTPVSILCKFV